MNSPELRDRTGNAPTRFNSVILTRVREALARNPDVSAEDVLTWGFGLTPVGAESYLNEAKRLPPVEPARAA